MRTQFIQPITLDGKQLQDELLAAGIIADLPNIDHDNNFWLNIDEKDIASAELVIAAHVAKPKTDENSKADLGV